jgi:hypothetical protein
MSNVILRPTSGCYVQQSYPSMNRNDEDRYRVGTVTQANWGVRSLLNFDVSSIPPMSIINSALLELYCYNDGSSYTATLEFYSRWITSAWDPSTVTWNTQPSATTTGEAASTPQSGYNKWYECSMKDIVQAWVNGTTNNGVLLIQDPQIAQTNKAFYKSGDYRPKLTIDYTPVGCHVRHNGEWRRGLVFARINGVWEQGLMYARSDGSWKQGN